jgi:hypothetical protein
MIERSRNIRRRSIFVHLGKSFTRIWYALPLSLYMALTIWCPKSTFYGNRAACYSSLHSYELVIADCSSSIHLNMNYTKVIVRRAQAYEALEKYDEALTGFSLSHNVFFLLYILYIYRYETSSRNRTGIS